MIDAVPVRQRIKRAIKELETELEEIGYEGADADKHLHLRGKLEGLKLALNYVEDAIR